MCRDCVRWMLSSPMATCSSQLPYKPMHLPTDKDWLGGSSSAVVGVEYLHVQLQLMKALI